MNTLYHYTSVGGFESIISNNSIRMTKSDFLNDPSDCNLFTFIVDNYLNQNADVLNKTIRSLEKSECVEQLYKKDCDLISYMHFLHKKINLYVLSLSELDDSMSMWNYYGRGGMEIAIDTEKLIQSFVRSFVSGNEFLTASKVIYIGSDEKADEVNVPNFSDFRLINRFSKDVFGSHKDFIKKKSYYKTSQLYDTSNLSCFINTYLKSYVTSMEFLLRTGIISENSTPESVFNAIFDNVSKLSDFLYWKHDLSLYMLVLSSLLKSNTYEYEKEYRIVYFEYDTQEKKNKEELFFVKHISSGDFISPYIQFKFEQCFKDSLKQVTLSPMTKNLPIYEKMYIDTLKKFLEQHGFSLNQGIKKSNHTIRW